MNLKELASALTAELSLPESSSNEDVLAAVQLLKSPAAPSDVKAVDAWEARVTAKIRESLNSLTREGAAEVLRQADIAEAKKAVKTATT